MKHRNKMARKTNQQPWRCSANMILYIYFSFSFTSLPRTITSGLLLIQKKQKEMFLELSVQREINCLSLIQAQFHPGCGKEPRFLCRSLHGVRGCCVCISGGRMRIWAPPHAHDFSVWKPVLFQKVAAGVRSGVYLSGWARVLKGLGGRG